MNRSHNKTFPFAASLSALTALWALIFTAPGIIPAQAQGQDSEDTPAMSEVSVNREILKTATLVQFEKRFHCHVPAGSYWYDRHCGAWGREGGPTLGFLPAGMDLGGRLRADASNGDTGVFVNGRELHLLDVIGLQRLGVPVRHGHWWVRANGDFGSEGFPLPLGNLLRFVRSGRARSQSSGSVYSGMAGGSVAFDGHGNVSALFRNSNGSYSDYNSGD